MSPRNFESRASKDRPALSAKARGEQKFYIETRLQGRTIASVQWERMDDTTWPIFVLTDGTKVEFFVEPRDGVGVYITPDFFYIETRLQGRTIASVQWERMDDTTWPIFLLHDGTKVELFVEPRDGVGVYITPDLKETT
jgi:hypothetical protein